ncbi:helicase-related protein [Pyrococcus abyssi]|uniref:DEAH ATP-dependent helicase n=1 Tax=Pyrococcus abyssi (strain GE5 / Orsay) TaxID=272844 RepID=Q9V0B0_PYRAB|nr:helicase-related protein [Pyrococcus abyssi]CAB49794.1 Putative DEAH ATP-dependent helicase [Pyrococcus abyssi GE5]CCE70286.1 TPA: putative deah atp-dependent helicase [Pyrococcus abyssi GE5]
MNLPEALLRELVLHSPNLFYMSLAWPGRKKIEPFLHQLQPLYHAMIQRPVRMFIADEIGLGKTIQALAIARYLNLKGEAKRILILVPKILREQWREEVERLGIIPIVIESGAEVESKLRRKEGFFIVSIDLAKMPEHRDKFLEKEWDLVIIDEAHNVTLGTQRYEFVKDLVGKNKDLNVIFLSATPHRGDPKDYLARLTLLDPTLIDDYSKLDSQEFYRRTMGTIIFRRTKSIVNELEGENIFRKCYFGAIVVGITEEEKEFFRRLNDVLSKLVKNTQKNSPQALLAVLVNKRASSSYSSAMKTLNKIVESYSVREVNLGKVRDYIERLFGLGYEDVNLEGFSEYDDVIDKIIEEYSAVLQESQVREFRELLDVLKRIKMDTKLNIVANVVKQHVERGEKVIIFTEFKDTLEYLRKNLPSLAGLSDEDVSILHGGMPSGKVEEEIRKFEKHGKLLISTDVASEGLNLQVANVLINYEAPWTPIKLEQRVGRVWRINQKRDVKAYTIFLDTEVDMYVLNNLYRKIMNIKEAIGGGPRVGIPVLAEKILEGDFEKIWKDIPGDFEAREKISEYDIGYAILRREIEGYKRAILNTLRILRQSIRGAVPQERVENIKRELELALGEDGLKKEDISDVVKDYLRELLGINVPEVTPILHRILVSGEEIKRGIKVGVKKGKAELFLVKLVRDGNEIHRIPVMVENGEVVYGIKLLQRLVELLKDGYVILGEANLDSPHLAKIIGVGRERLYKVREKYRKYERWLKRKMLKRDYLFTETQVVPEKIVEFEPLGEKFKMAKLIPLGLLEHLGLSQEDISLPTKEDELLLTRNFVPLEDILKAEAEAMRIVIELEKEKLRKEYGEEGWEVKDVSLHEHYDILVRHPDGEKYIEVKGHLPLLLQAELTEAEAKFAKENEDKYWLYIVTNIRKRPIILKVFKPLSNPRIFLVTGKGELEITGQIKVKIKERKRTLLSIGPIEGS